MQSEEFEQLDELSKSTLGKYLNKSMSQDFQRTAKKDRTPGMQKAYKKMTTR